MLALMSGGSGVRRSIVLAALVEHHRCRRRGICVWSRLLRPRHWRGATAKPKPTVTLAAQAYVWGLPLVVSMRTAQMFSKVVGTDHLVNQTKLTGPGPQIVVAPNVDTLYSVAVLDLRSGPEMLTVPEIHDRYYVYQFLDMYTQSFAYVGTRATAGRAGSWVVAAPGWHGQVPAGDSVIRSSTPVVFLLGRFLVSGVADLPATRAMMTQVRLAPLNDAASLGQSQSRPNGTASTATLPANQLGLGAVSRNPSERRRGRRGLFRRAGR